MRVAILGAPGVGKSKLARAIGKEHDLTVVDNYIQRLQKKTDLALGPWCSYSEHFMVAGHRLAAEYAVGFDKRITVTTIADTLAYASMKSDVVMKDTDEERRALFLRVQSSMQGLGLIYSETWDYDISFYLPYSEKEKKEKERWEVILDSVYPSVIESFTIRDCYTLLGNHNERLKIINETIDTIKETDEPETPETD